MSAIRIHPPATAFTTSINHLTCNPNTPTTTNLFTANCRTLKRSRFRRNLTTIAMSSNPLEVCAKASLTVANTLGDCPFTQRVLLTLEEKHLPYNLNLIDLRKKTEWFRSVSPDGEVPVVKLDDKWIANSDVITQTIEEKFPDPPLVTPPEKASIVSKIFPTFIGLLKSKVAGDGKEEALLNELSAFNDHIKENGPFINGKDVSAADLSIGPKLYHMEIALGHFKKWTVPDSLPHLKTYMETVFALESFIKTTPLTEDVIEGWRPKVMG